VTGMEYKGVDFGPRGSAPRSVRILRFFGGGLISAMADDDPQLGHSPSLRENDASRSLPVLSSRHSASVT